jgi:hypothetical protein
MNNFLNLHDSADYRNINRPYYTGTWEYIIIASDYLIPFHFSGSGSDPVISKIDTAGTVTSISSRFRGLSDISGWTHTGTGSDVSSGAELVTWIPDSGDYWVSNNFAVGADEAVRVAITASAFDDSAKILFELRKGSTSLWSSTAAAWSGVKYQTCAGGSDYNIKISDIGGGSGITMVTNTPAAQISRIHNSGTDWWYDGGELFSFPASLEGIWRLRVAIGSDTYYGDWMDDQGFTDKMKYKVSSSYDFGGLPYSSGFEQWIYKDASVRRNPRAEITVTAEQRNGVRIDEKIVSAVRYLVKMKVTESEYEAFVHSIGGTVTITDATGKEYTCTAIEMSDPVWYRGNGILEITFVDENNINIWTMNQ